MTTPMKRKRTENIEMPCAGNFLRPLAMALSTALLLSAALPVQAQFSSSGDPGRVYTFPGNQAIPNGPGNADLGLDDLFVGNDGFGSFSVLGGSEFRVGSMLIGASGSGGGNGNGLVLIDGTGSSVFLVGSGNRLNVGHQDVGSLTVSGGATLNGRTESATCLSCSVYVGNAAGSSGTLTVTGANTTASFLGNFGIGSTFVDTPNNLGIPGRSTNGVVKVLAGGSLTTDNATVGMGPAGNGLLGTERSFASVLIDGTDSVWKITGSSSGNGSAFFNTATHPNAWATIDVRNGGTLWIDGKPGVFNALNLTTQSGGGRTDMLVTGIGSRVLFTGDAGLLNVGGIKGSATLGVTAGATISGVNSLGVGRNGSFGTLNIDGSGSQVLLDGIASVQASITAGSPAAPSAPFAQIGREGGTGVVNVTGGGSLTMLSTIGTPNSLGFEVGRVTTSVANPNFASLAATTSGTLNISGANSVVSITALSAKDAFGAEQAFNPYMKIGRDGTGILNVSGGGKLLIDGQAMSTNNDRGTSLYIGGRSDSVIGGRGFVSVTGSGSEIRMTGSDTYIGIGHGPQSSGQLAVSDHALVSTTALIVGRRGGVGLLSVDNANVSVTGQASTFGAFMSLGYGLSSTAGSIGVAGNGTATVTNGGSILISNMGTFGADLTVGGTTGVPKGNGSLALASGSSLSVQAASGLARARIGVNGAGLVSLSGGSSLNVGDGNLLLAETTAGVGTLLAIENSTITAGWVGIGRNRSNVDGGVGTMLLNSGATLTADTVVIGTKGYLGGSGGSIIANQIDNYGTFSPGNSPGVFNITGNYTQQAGSRMVLEVESDGMNGFNTDLVLFSAGSVVDLNPGTIEFRFLGATDPNGFKTSGAFDLNTFMAISDINGVQSPLQLTAYAGTQFVATSKEYAFTNFSYSAAGGAVFNAAPVPEPSTWAMMFAGVMLLGTMAARRRKQSPGADGKP